MPRQLSKSIMIDESGQRQALIRLEFVDRGYDEAWLQKLLFDHAYLLPVGELEPVFGDHVAVCRELPTPAGPVDLLYINPRGFITLVETKLWRNPDARRSVIAQIIDYTKEMARWTYEDLVNAVQRANGQKLERFAHSTLRRGRRTRGGGFHRFSSKESAVGSFPAPNRGRWYPRRHGAHGGVSTGNTAASLQPRAG